jgi:hypothetical protein
MSNDGDRVRCSRCGGEDDLHLVVAGVSSPAAGKGRVLVYCRDCRRPESGAPPCSTAIPLPEVTEEVLLDLYEKGFTASDPDTAVEIVFGRDLPQLAAKIRSFLGE